MDKEPIAKSPSGRTKRTPVGQRNVLTVTGKDPAYEYRVVNDSADRISMFEDAGWEKVLAKDVRIGDKRINSTTPEGTIAQASVGQGQKAIVMKIKKEWYAEDQAAKEAQIKALEESTIQKAQGSGDYGSVTMGRP